jgi:hypothetical protein
LQLSSDYMDLEKAEIPSDKVAMMEEFERRKRVRAITVSTNDSEVRDNSFFSCCRVLS